MDLHNLKTEYNRLKNILVDNYEEYYNKELLIDFYEDGWNEKISQLDELLYLEPFSIELTNLLLQSENLEDTESLKIKIKLIGIKKDIDIQISENKFYEEGIPLIITDNINGIPLTNGVDIKLIKQLEDLLIRNDFIKKPSSSSLTSIFECNWNQEKIQWIDVEYLFSFLINHLQKNKITSSKMIRNKYKLFSLFFVNKKGNDFNSNQVSKSVYNLRTEHTKIREKLLINIISELFLLK